MKPNASSGERKSSASDSFSKPLTKKVPKAPQLVPTQAAEVLERVRGEPRPLGKFPGYEQQREEEGTRQQTQLAIDAQRVTRTLTAAGDAQLGASDAQRGARAEAQRGTQADAQPGVSKDGGKLTGAHLGAFKDGGRLTDAQRAASDAQRGAQADVQPGAFKDGGKLTEAQRGAQADAQRGASDAHRGASDAQRGARADVQPGAFKDGGKLTDAQRGAHVGATTVAQPGTSDAQRGAQASKGAGALPDTQQGAQVFKNAGALPDAQRGAQAFKDAEALPGAQRGAQASKDAGALTLNNAGEGARAMDNAKGGAQAVKNAGGETQAVNNAGKGAHSVINAGGGVQTVSNVGGEFNNPGAPQQVSHAGGVFNSAGGELNNASLAQQFSNPGGTAPQLNYPSNRAQQLNNSGGWAQQMDNPGGRAQQMDNPGGWAQQYDNSMGVNNAGFRTQQGPSQHGRAQQFNNAAGGVHQFNNAANGAHQFNNPAGGAYQYKNNSVGGADPFNNGGYYNPMMPVYYDNPYSPSMGSFYYGAPNNGQQAAMLPQLPPILPLFQAHAAAAAVPAAVPAAVLAAAPPPPPPPPPPASKEFISQLHTLGLHTMLKQNPSCVMEYFSRAKAETENSDVILKNMALELYQASLESSALGKVLRDPTAHVSIVEVLFFVELYFGPDKVKELAKALEIGDLPVEASQNLRTLVQNGRMPELIVPTLGLELIGAIGMHACADEKDKKFQFTLEAIFDVLDPETKYEMFKDLLMHEEELLNDAFSSRGTHWLIRVCDYTKSPELSKLAVRTLGMLSANDFLKYATDEHTAKWLTSLVYQTPPLDLAHDAFHGESAYLMSTGRTIHPTFKAFRDRLGEWVLKLCIHPHGIPIISACLVNPSYSDYILDKMFEQGLNDVVGRVFNEIIGIVASDVDLQRKTKRLMRLKQVGKGLLPGQVEVLKQEFKKAGLQVPKEGHVGPR